MEDSIHDQWMIFIDSSTDFKTYVNPTGESSYENVITAGFLSVLEKSLKIFIKDITLKS